MASEQAKRGKKVTYEQKINEVEKNKVPTMATHFESLAEKPSSPSLEEISKMRATAQQNSIGAIRAAEKRFQKAEEADETMLDHASKVAGKVKDQAVVASWGATHYTMEKVVDATKTVASVAGYTKDKVVGAGQTVGGYAVEKLAAAKDAVVETEEKAADYAAMKKAEAQKSSSCSQGRQDDDKGLSLGSKANIDHEYVEGAEEYGDEQTSTDTGTVFQAIGETIVEIGQTTKDLLAGQYPLQGKSGKENDE